MTVVEGEVPQPTALSAAAVANGHDTSPVDPLVKLGDDVFLLVLELLPPLELPKLCGVSQLWRDHLYNSDKLWRKACRELGVDLREWAHSVGETAALGKDEPYLPPDVSDYDRVVKEDKLGTSGFDCPRAIQSHVLLEQAWKDRHAYEMLLAAPAFRLRYVYMDHEEDTVYALTESSVTSREEHLLVFHKYTGSLLLRLPVCAFPHIAVGAGYVAVSQYAKADIDENGPGEATKLGAVTIYRTARAACRAAANWNGVKKEWKPRGLPLEYYMTLDHLQECRAMNVGFVNGEGVLVAASKETRTLYMFYLDTGRRAEFAYSMGPAWDTALPDERVPEVSAVHTDDEHVFIALSSQVLVYTHRGEHVVSFPDRQAAPEDVAACVYPVHGGYPYTYGPDVRPERPDEAQPGIDIADTLSWQMHGFRAWVDGEINGRYLTHSSNTFTAWRDDDQRLALTFKELSFTRSHLVVRYHVQRGHHGGVFIVPNYRKILAQCKTLEQPERVQHVAHHTALIALSLGPDVIATEPQSDRLAVHCAVACVIIIDLALLPEFPLDRGTPRPVVSGGSSESDEPDIVVLSEQELEAMAEALIAHNQPSEQAAMANATSVTALGSSLENDQAAEDAEPGEPTEPHAPPHLSLVVSGPENGEIANNDEDEEDDGEDDDDDDDDSDSDDSYYVNEAAKGDVSPLPAYVFEISCLEGMAEESSVVMDSRAVYMCDWDKGVPDGTVDYEDLHEGEVNLDMWEWKIRANFGHLKIWTFRPDAALLRRAGVVEWQDQMKAALGKTRESWHLAEAALLAQAEARRNYDWADSLDGMVWLGLRDADEEDDEEIEEIEDFEDPFMEVLEDNVWETDEDV